MKWRKKAQGLNQGQISRQTENKLLEIKRSCCSGNLTSREIQLPIYSLEICTLIFCSALMMVVSVRKWTEPRTHYCKGELGREMSWKDYFLNLHHAAASAKMMHCSSDRFPWFAYTGSPSRMRTPFSLKSQRL